MTVGIIQRKPVLTSASNAEACWRRWIRWNQGITDFSYPRPFVPKNERSLWRTFVPQERKFQELSFLSLPGTFILGERKFQGTFVPGPFRSRELSFPENESSSELSFLGPFVPGNFRSHYPIGLVGALLCVLNYCMFGCDFTLIIIILIILFVLNKTTQHMTATQNYEQDQQDSTSAMMLTPLWTSQLTLYVGRPAFAACLSDVPITVSLCTQRLR